MSTDLPIRPGTPDAETAPFWTALSEDRFVLPHCRSCEFVIWYPRQFCPQCQSRSVEWREASGRGTIYSFSIVNKNVGSWGAVTPYAVAYVEVAEGPRVLTNIVTDTPETLAIGQQVIACIQHDGDAAVLRFRPDGP